jgi:hypothetical protein
MSGRHESPAHSDLPNEDTVELAAHTADTPVGPSEIRHFDRSAVIAQLPVGEGLKQLFNETSFVITLKATL